MPTFFHGLHSGHRKDIKFSKLSSKTTCLCTSPTKTLTPPPRDMWGLSGALSPYWQLFGSPYVGDSCVLPLLSRGMWGISRRFVLIQDVAIVPSITSEYISAHWSGHKCSQVIVESILLLFKSIHRLI